MALTAAAYWNGEREKKQKKQKKPKNKQQLSSTAAKLESIPTCVAVQLQARSCTDGVASLMAPTGSSCPRAANTKQKTQKKHIIVNVACWV